MNTSMIYEAMHVFRRYVRVYVLGVIFIAGDVVERLLGAARF